MEKRSKSKAGESHKRVERINGGKRKTGGDTIFPLLVLNCLLLNIPKMSIARSLEDHRGENRKAQEKRSAKWTEEQEWGRGRNREKEREWMEESGDSYTYLVDLDLLIHVIVCVFHTLYLKQEER